MEGLLLDMYRIVDFAKRMRKKLSPLAEVKSRERSSLNKIIGMMKAELDKQMTSSNPSTAARAKLAQVVFPLLAGEEDINHNVAQEYAFACGHMIGLLAGLSLKGDAVEGAINEILEVAQSTGREVLNTLKNAGFTEVNSHEEPSPAEAAAKTSSMISELMSKAETESDPATAAALRQLAANMKISA